MLLGWKRQHGFPRILRRAIFTDRPHEAQSSLHGTAVQGALTISERSVKIAVQNPGKSVLTLFEKRIPGCARD